MESEPGKGDYLIQSVSKCEEKCYEYKAMSFGNFFEELKQEPIDYEWANNEDKCEEIEHKDKNELNLLEKRSNVKVKQGGIEFSHEYLMYGKFREGKKLYKSGEYKKAKKLFRESAEGGCAQGMHALAIVYYNDEGCKESIHKASHWAAMSIQHGNKAAKQTLDKILEEAEQKQRRCFIF